MTTVFLWRWRSSSGAGVGVQTGSREGYTVCVCVCVHSVLLSHWKCSGTLLRRRPSEKMKVFLGSSSVLKVFRSLPAEKLSLSESLSARRNGASVPVRLRVTQKKDHIQPVFVWKSTYCRRVWSYLTITSEHILLIISWWASHSRTLCLDLLHCIKT